MNRIATLSVIRGEGRVDAIMNGVVSQELRRLQDIRDTQMANERHAYKKEIMYLRSEGDAARQSRNRLLRDRMDRFAAELKPSFAYRVKSVFQIPWAWTYCLFTGLFSYLRHR